jgi:hypothetical protein
LKDLLFYSNINYKSYFSGCLGELARLKFL